MKFKLCKIKRRHEFAEIETASVEIKKYKCVHCNQLFTTDGYGNKVKMNLKWEKNHQLFASYYKNRIAV